MKINNKYTIYLEWTWELTDNVYWVAMLSELFTSLKLIAESKKIDNLYGISVIYVQTDSHYIKKIYNSNYNNFYHTLP